MPKKEDNWILRPHHVETLTAHTQSVKDDVLNTRYFSHYNQDYGKKDETNPAVLAISHIEDMLEELKGKQMTMATPKGKDIYDENEKLKKKTDRIAHEKFELFMARDRVPEDTKVLMISAYEDVLLKHRRKERDMLNRQRMKEYEKNRPPQDKWYELKSTEFAKELYRNRVALKPDNQNEIYLKKL